MKEKLNYDLQVGTAQVFHKLQPQVAFSLDTCGLSESTKNKHDILFNPVTLSLIKKIGLIYLTLIVPVPKAGEVTQLQCACVQQREQTLNSQ